MIDNLKKYWFVVVIGLVLIVGIGYFTKEQMNAVLSGKKVDGKDVIYEVAGSDYTADAYYDELFESKGTAEIYKLFERAVLDSMETTEDIVEKSKEEAETVKTNVSAQNGAAGLEQLNKALVSLGYTGVDEMNKFYENSNKLDVILGDYLEANYDQYAKAFVEEKQPRVVSHILVKMDDSKNPTAEESAKMEKIDAALKEGKAFSDVAMEFSDDGTAQNGGLLGYMDKTSSLVPEFIEGATSIKKGETTGWVTSQYGRHRITVQQDSFEEIKYDKDFLKAISTNNPKIQYQAIWEKAEGLDIKFADENVKADLMAFMGLGGNQ